MKLPSLRKIARPAILTVSFTCTFLVFSLGSLDITLRLFSHFRHPGLRHFAADIDRYKYVKEEYFLGGLTISDIKSLMKETWVNHGWEYEPILGFKETPRSGRFVNISTAGYRLNNAMEPSTDDLIKSNEKIYVFGGSTTFGYGVNDSATIPANLSKAFPNAKVFNFGRGYYYSEQENHLLDQILSSGISKPKLAIFIDGINERCGQEVYQSEMKSIFSSISGRNYNWTPREFMKPITSIFSKLKKTSTGLQLSQERCKDAYSGSSISIAKRFEDLLRKRAMMCDNYRVKCLTYIQPFPGHKNIHVHGKLTESAAKKANDLSKVSVVSEFHDTLDITNSLEGLKKHAYVDSVHYSPSAMQIIAKLVATTARVHLEN